MGMRFGAVACAAGVAVMSVVLSCGALAQAAFPERPIRLVIPFPPGGVYDTIGRPLAEKLKVTLGAFVIENMGGAGGARGAAAAARAQPDGHTLLLAGTGVMVIIPTAARRPLYDPVQDFEPISGLAVVGFSFVTHPGVPARTLKELVAYARAEPGKLSFGTPGAGTLNHLTGEMFKAMAGTPDIAHVPYAGGGPALNELIGGHIPLAVVNVTGQVLELHRTGKLRMLAMTSPARLAQLPEVPTAIEAGYPDMVSQIFGGLFAPKGTPKAIVEKLAQAVSTALADPELQKFYVGAGFEPEREASPEKMRAFLQGELTRWKPVIEASGYKLD